MGGRVWPGGQLTSCLPVPPSAPQHPREGGLLPQHLLPPQSPGPHLHRLRRASSAQRPVVLAAVDPLQDLCPAQPVSVAPACVPAFQPCPQPQPRPPSLPAPSREPCSKRKPSHHGTVANPASVGPTRLPGEPRPQSCIIRETPGCACGVQGAPFTRLVPSPWRTTHAHAHELLRAALTITPQRRSGI